MDNFLEFPFIIKTSYLQLSFFVHSFCSLRGEGGDGENSFDVSYDDCYDDLIFSMDNFASSLLFDWY